MPSTRFQLVPGARLGDRVPAGSVAWRLLGGNNRELGRSPREYADSSAAIAALRVVRQQAATVESRVWLDQAARAWRWSLGARETMAISGRPFRRERECRYNLEQFREHAASSPLPVEIPAPREADVRERIDAVEAPGEVHA